MGAAPIARALLAFWLLTLAYIGLLLWLDHDKGLFFGVERLSALLPTLCLISFVSYLARYARWHWLLSRAKVPVPVLRGLTGYFAGFALTSTPGKLGELLRVRYFHSMGAAPQVVVAAFVYERSFDLLVVLALASLSAAGFGLFPLAVLFVSVVLMVVFMLARFPGLSLRASACLECWRLPRAARLVELLAQGFADTAIWLKLPDLVISLVCGLLAWGLTAYAFVVLLAQLGLSVPAVQAFSVYPLAMLAGAASMIPGGIGSTEVVLIAVLNGYGIGVADGALAAIGIRLATLWFATLLGVLSMLSLELSTWPLAATQRLSR